MPEQTVAAFEDHGSLARTIDRDLDEATDLLQHLDALGIDMASRVGGQRMEAEWREITV